MADAFGFGGATVWTVRGLMRHRELNGTEVILVSPTLGKEGKVEVRVRESGRMLRISPALLSGAHGASLADLLEGLHSEAIRLLCGAGGPPRPL